MQLFLLGALFLTFMYTAINPTPQDAPLSPSGEKPLMVQKNELAPSGLKILREIYKDRSTCIKVLKGKNKVCLGPHSNATAAPVFKAQWLLEGKKGVGFLYADQIECEYTQDELTCAKKN